jgi:hypothetical protein
MPKGITAPGNVSPPLVVPIKGLTASAGDTALCAHALPTIASETLAHRTRDFIDATERDIGDITDSDEGGNAKHRSRGMALGRVRRKIANICCCHTTTPTRLIQDN